MKWLLGLGLVFALGCGEEASGTLAVGAECASTSDCDTSEGQTCLTGFKGGYCGIADCGASSQCPGDSACALYANGVGYAFEPVPLALNVTTFAVPL